MKKILGYFLIFLYWLIALPIFVLVVLMIVFGRIFSYLTDWCETAYENLLSSTVDNIKPKLKDRGEKML